MRVGLQDYEERRIVADAALARVADRWEGVQALYAAELRAVARDGIRDDDLYRRLHTTQRWADRGATIGLVPGPWSVVTAPASAVAATTSTGLSVGFRVAYGEGSWKDVGATIALGRLRTAAKVLKYGATALPRNGLATEEVMTAAERLRIGARRVGAETYAGRRGAGPTSGVGKVVNPPIAGSVLRRTWATARQRAAAEAERRYLADYRIATTNGSTAKRMILTSWAFDGTAKVVTVVDKGQQVRDRLRERRGTEAEERRSA